MALTRPPATSILSKVTELPQGITMGLQGSFDSLGRVVGPLWAGYAYDLNQSFPFLCACGRLGRRVVVYENAARRAQEFETSPAE